MPTLFFLFIIVIDDTLINMEICFQVNPGTRSLLIRPTAVQTTVTAVATTPATQVCYESTIKIRSHCNVKKGVDSNNVVKF